MLYWALLWPPRLAAALRRVWFLFRAQAAARSVASRISVRLAPGARVGRRILIEIEPKTVNSLQVGAGTVIGDDAVLQFRGGAMVVGERTIIRRGAQVDTSGELLIGDECLVSYGTYLHCATSTTVGDMTTLSEYVTLTDSSHVRTPLDVPVFHHVTASPTAVGRNCWLGAHVVVAAGVHIGDGAVIGANSTVTKDVPGGWLAAGSPARAIRRLEVEEVEP